MERVVSLRAFLLELATLGWEEFHHGDCLGADAAAHANAVALGFRIILHPPTANAARAFSKAPGAEMTTYPPLPYLERNKAIVDGTDLLIAMPKDARREEVRSGTWATVRYARKKNRSIVFF